jgi:hypothetical protein
MLWTARQKAKKAKGERLKACMHGDGINYMATIRVTTQCIDRKAVKTRQRNAAKQGKTPHIYRTITRRGDK